MSKILSYNDKSNGEDWFNLGAPYNKKEIESIEDPDGGKASSPKIAIPSPFAQLDLVKNAFLRLADDTSLNGNAMDMRLVSNSLDIAQVFFNFDNYQNLIRLIVWNREEGIRMLKQNPSHRLLGETLEMYLHQDRVAYNFDKLDALYILSYRNTIIGATSPASMFIATPDAAQINRMGDFAEIAIEQGINLFDKWRPLYQRDSKFVEYMYYLFGAYPQLKKDLSEVNRYMITNFRLLKNYNPALYDSISQTIGSPETENYEKSEILRNDIQDKYSLIGNGVSILGYPLYKKKAADIRIEIKQSDFMMMPSRTDVEDELPLVLQNDLYAPASDPFRYITHPWDDKTQVPVIPSENELKNRILPGTPNYRYPWVTSNDFLTTSLIKFVYPTDEKYFFSGNISWTGKEENNFGFLLPIKPLYFKYFDIKDLKKTIGGKPCFEMVRRRINDEEQVTVYLRIPVRKNNGARFITLSRTYKASNSNEFIFNVDKNEGVFVQLPVSLSIFPFVRLKTKNQYNVQLIDYALGNFLHHRIDIDFFKDGVPAALNKEYRNRSSKIPKNVDTNYYKIESDFDYIRMYLKNERGYNDAEGIIVPQWKDFATGTEQFTFAIDFGTTNTHIEYMKGDRQPQPLKIYNNPNGLSMVATLFDPAADFGPAYNTAKDVFELRLKQEFLPRELDGIYGFPQRTVIAEGENLDIEKITDELPLCDANIPFIYEKESEGYNRIIPNLKWSTDEANSLRVKAYMTELMMLIRAKVLLDGGDPDKTKLIWFYPLSMKEGHIHQFEEGWQKAFVEIFDPKGEINIWKVPESIAPYYFYKNTNRLNASASYSVSIDIGGGTSDIAIFSPNSEEPHLITSFRFAANTLFGDAFAKIGQAASNPLVAEYTDYFKRLFDNEQEEFQEMNSILDNILSKGKSEEVNTFLFSIENSPLTKGNEIFSYNKKLSKDSKRKIIFLYFYAAIIYYVSRMMISKKLNKPKSILFSGTGSKVLDIIGNNKQLNTFTRYFIETIFKSEYDSDGFSVIMERNEPKQITCKGALIQMKDSRGREQMDKINDKVIDNINPIKYNFSMISDSKLKYGDMKDAFNRELIVEEVREFNKLFIDFCTRFNVMDTFLVDSQSFSIFKNVVGKNLPDLLLDGWHAYSERYGDGNDDDMPIEDIPFFYPIIGAIRNNLIENLKNR